MTRDDIGAGAIAALIVSALLLLVQIGLLMTGFALGMSILTFLIPTALAPLVALVQALVVTPAWCVWLLGRCEPSEPSATRRRRTIARTLALSAATFCVTMLTWYFVYTAPAVYIGHD